MNRGNLDFWLRSELMKWLEGHPKLRDLYLCKEALHSLYRCRGYIKAKAAFSRLMDAMAQSPWDEIKTLRGTLLNWRKEVLA